jgi:cytidylate kinase
MKCSAQRLIEALIGIELAQERKAAQEKADKARRASYVVTVSRGFGSNGKKVAQALADRLGVRCCDRTILKEVAARANVDDELVKKLDENIDKSSARPWKALFGGKTYTRERYLHHLVKVVLNISKKGGVIVGRGAHLILGPGKAFRVRIIGSPDACTARVAEREQIDIDAARKLVETVDQQRAEYLREIYGENIDESSDYDIVINSDHFDVPQMVGLVLNGMQQAGYDIPLKLLQTA